MLWTLGRLRPSVRFCGFILVATVLGCGAAASSEADFESAGPVLTADYVPTAKLQGAKWTVGAEATNDGYENTYTIESPYGVWQARGRLALESRIREVQALEQLEQVSKGKIVFDAVKTSATAPVKLVVDVAARPVETAKGIPQGVGRWLKKTNFRVQEGYHDVSTEVVEYRENKDDPEAELDGSEAASESSSELQDKAIAGATSAAMGYLKISRAELRWYKDLRLDPYTDNETVRKAVASVARIEGLTSFGMKFVIPSIPGVGELQKTMDLVWETDPAELRLRNRKLLVAAGLSVETARAFEDNHSLSLSQQTVFLEALSRLKAVSGREDLIARAIDLESRVDGNILMTSTVLLVKLDNGGTQLETILPGSRVPVARTTEGDLVAVAVAGAIFWTEEIAAIAQGFVDMYRDRSSGSKTLFVVGEASDRFVSEFEAQGWAVENEWFLEEINEGLPLLAPEEEAPKQTSGEAVGR